MSKKTLNQANLETLGAEKLAALLIEVSTGSADIKRRLRLELSHNLGAAELAHDVRKRLAAIRKSTSRVSWRKRKALVKDLDTQVRMIVDKIAIDDPSAAFDLLWQFIELAPSVYERVDDSRGEVGDVFRSALPALQEIAARAGGDPAALADRVWRAVQDNGYGEWDDIIALMAPALGADGLARLAALVQTFADADLPQTSADHEAIEFLRTLRGGADYAADRKAQFVRACLQQIALAAGDTQAYSAQYTDADLRDPEIAAEVAMLWLDDGQAAEALDLLENADQDGHGAGQQAWDDAYIACLTALGQSEAAQTHRWACFCATLNRTYLRDYLKLLPDFDDVEAEDRARQYVLAYPNFAAALTHFVQWPDLPSAAHMVHTRSAEINGDLYVVLAPAAQALRARHPLAAVMLWRAMIEVALDRGQAFRYALAAEYLSECASAAADVTDGDELSDHDSYVQELQGRFGHVSSFWKKLR